MIPKFEIKLTVAVAGADVDGPCDDEMLNAAIWAILDSHRFGDEDDFRITPLTLSCRPIVG